MKRFFFLRGCCEAEVGHSSFLSSSFSVEREREKRESFVEGHNSRSKRINLNTFLCIIKYFG